MFLEEPPFKSPCRDESYGILPLSPCAVPLKNGVVVYVENPLSVKRFIQLKLAKVKSDAKSIREYALINEVPVLYTALTGSRANVCGYLDCWTVT